VDKSGSKQLFADLAAQEFDIHRVGGLLPITDRAAPKRAGKTAIAPERHLDWIRQKSVTPLRESPCLIFI
jgi:hypothetical protein